MLAIATESTASLQVDRYRCPLAAWRHSQQNRKERQEHFIPTRQHIHPRHVEHLLHRSAHAHRRDIPLLGHESRRARRRATWQFPFQRPAGSAQSHMQRSRGLVRSGCGDVNSARCLRRQTYTTVNDKPTSMSQNWNSQRSSQRQCRIDSRPVSGSPRIRCDMTLSTM